MAVTRGQQGAERRTVQFGFKFGKGQQVGLNCCEWTDRRPYPERVWSVCLVTSQWGRSVAVARGQLSAERRTDGLGQKCKSASAKVQKCKDIAVAGARGQQGLSAARHYRRWESGDDFNGHGRTDHPEV